MTRVSTVIMNDKIEVINIRVDSSRQHERINRTKMRNTKQQRALVEPARESAREKVPERTSRSLSEVSILPTLEHNYLFLCSRKYYFPFIK